MDPYYDSDYYEWSYHQNNHDYPEGPLWDLVGKQQNWIEQGIKLSKQVTRTLDSKLEGWKSEANTADSSKTESASDDPTALLTRSNHRPSPQQSDTLIAIKKKKLAEAAAIEDEIMDIVLKVKETMQPSLEGLLRRLEELKTTMEALQQSRRQRRAEARAYDFMMSPIRLLPPEILSRVFAFAISSPDPKERASILELSQTCSAWRHAAVTSSSLWNNMDYFFRRLTRPGYLQTYFPTWFCRANASRPLSLTLTMGDVYWSNRTWRATADDLAKGISPFLPRLVKLSLTITNGEYRVLELFLSLPEGSLPALEFLQLVDYTAEKYREKPEPEAPFTVSVFGAAPKLYKAHLGLQMPLIYDAPHFALPWGQLEHLYLNEGVGPYSFAKLICQCSHLRTLCVEGLTFEDDPDAEDVFVPPSPIVFDRLEVLKIKLMCRGLGFAMVSIAPLLAMLQFPKVETMHLSGHQWGCPFPIHGILDSLSSATKTIKHLSLSFVIFDPDLVPFIVSCTALESLMLCDRTDMSLDILEDLAEDSVIASSIEPTQTEIPLSQLNSFTFVCRPADDQDTKDICKAFSHLVLSWLHDPALPRPLKSISLLVTDALSGRRNQEKTDMVLKQTLMYLNAKKGGSALSGVEVTTESVPFDSLVERFGRWELDEFPMYEREPSPKMTRSDWNVFYG